MPCELVKLDATRIGGSRHGEARQGRRPPRQGSGIGQGRHLALEPGPRHRRNPHHHRNPRLVPHLGVRRHRIQRHRSRPTRRYRHRPNTAGGFSMPRFTYPKIAAVVLAVLTAFAGPASAKPGEAHFAPTQTSYRYDGIHGIFTGDAVYGPEPKLFWSLRLSESVRAIVVGP